MKIELNTDVCHDKAIHKKGTVVDFPDKVAAKLIDQGHAKEPGKNGKAAKSGE